MILLKLAWKSLMNRKLSSLLTVLSLALSVTLLLTVERTKRASEESFTQAISQTDLIVGARSSPVNLLLYTVFNMGSATNNISWKTYQEFKSHPAVEWTIPYSLGDGHRGFRVVATDSNFYEHYRFRKDQRLEFAEGSRADGLWDVVIGNEVQRTLKYQLGDKVLIAHGVTRGEGILMHDDKPFRVVGILKPTGTALDQSLYITLEGMEAVHIDWKDGAMPGRDAVIAADQIMASDIHVDQITSFFLRTKTRIETLRLQREINTYSNEPLMAIIPGVALGELWRSLGYFESALRMISWMVILVGLSAMLIALLTTLNERRREMAILRSLGASPGKIALLLVLEAFVLTVLGVVFGVIVQSLALWILKDWLLSEFGLFLTGGWLSTREILSIVAILMMGLLAGLVPALRSMRQSLKDGLTIQV